MTKLKEIKSASSEDTSTSVEIGDRLREIRRDRGLTLMEVADKTGISSSALSKIENNKMSPTFANLIKIAEGASNKEIASALGVSPNTIKFHIKNLFEKLGVSNRSQAVALYLKS